MRALEVYSALGAPESEAIRGRLAALERGQAHDPGDLVPALTPCFTSTVTMNVPGLGREATESFGHAKVWLLRAACDTEYRLMRSSSIGGGSSVDDVVRSESGVPLKAVYDAAELAGFDPDTALGEPGAFPFTRGVYPSMYTGRPWTMRQYAGFGTAKESNARYHELVANGTGGLSVAFDLPTQMGYDSDEAIARGEVGKVGVAIDSLDDMRVLFDGLPLGEISTSMTINAPAATLLLLYQLVGEDQGIPGSKLR